MFKWILTKSAVKWICIYSKKLSKLFIMIFCKDECFNLDVINAWNFDG